MGGDTNERYDMTEVNESGLHAMKIIGTYGLAEYARQWTWQPRPKGFRLRPRAACYANAARLGVRHQTRGRDRGEKTTTGVTQGDQLQVQHGRVDVHAARRTDRHTTGATRQGEEQVAEPLVNGRVGGQNRRQRHLRIKEEQTASPYHYRHPIYGVMSRSRN